MAKEKTITDLNRALKPYKKFSPKGMIAKSLGRSKTWIGMVFSEKFQDDSVVEVGWEVLEICKKMKRKESIEAIKKLKENVN